MVGHTVLKRRHSLVGMKLLPLIRRAKETSVPKQWARVSTNKVTEDMTIKDVETAFMQITGEALDEFMELVGKPHNLENTRLLLHCAIVLANEVGQPKGQDLADNQQGKEEMNCSVIVVPEWEKNNDFNPSQETIRKYQKLTTLGGSGPCSSACNPSGEEVLNGNNQYDINTLPVYDPTFFVAFWKRNLHTHVYNGKFGKFIAEPISIENRV